MAKSPTFYVLRSGYRVRISDEDSREHLINAIVGESLVSAKRIADHARVEIKVDDQATKLIFDECRHLSEKYKLRLTPLVLQVFNHLAECIEEAIGRCTSAVSHPDSDGLMN